jgi:hypothetical protein
MYHGHPLTSTSLPSVHIPQKEGPEEAHSQLFRSLLEGPHSHQPINLFMSPQQLLMNLMASMHSNTFQLHTLGQVKPCSKPRN